MSSRWSAKNSRAGSTGALVLAANGRAAGGAIRAAGTAASGEATAKETLNKNDPQNWPFFCLPESIYMILNSEYAQDTIRASGGNGAKIIPGNDVILSGGEHYSSDEPGGKASKKPIQCEEDLDLSGHRRSASRAAC